MCATPVTVRAHTRITRAIIFNPTLEQLTCFIITLIRKVCFILIMLWNISRHFFNQSEVKPKSILTCSHAFFTIAANYMYFPLPLIGSLDCIRLLWLARKITLVLVLVLRHWSINRSTISEKQINLGRYTRVKIRFYLIFTNCNVNPTVLECLNLLSSQGCQGPIRPEMLKLRCEILIAARYIYSYIYNALIFSHSFKPIK